MKLVVSKDILKVNDKIAEIIGEKLENRGVMAVNILGSPGCGKTALIEALVKNAGDRFKFAVIEGDLATSRDAERIEKLNVPAVQINTGGGCHLDANMVLTALDDLDLDYVDVLLIENVGNLVCPAAFKLGERKRFAALSVPEGDDKVAKYPTMFQSVDAVVVNKIDLMAYLDFDIRRVENDLSKLAPGLKPLLVSAKTGEGIVEFSGLIEKAWNEFQKAQR
ncbi:MAG: hydrogenase nickel incorporation protein HypB [candidate division Zixibacteria bacterium]|nr:hydrogenase nickel incorporation protein HypB [candidate division Zixibacteria bacterium]